MKKKYFCPECNREMAHGWDDVIAGMCPKRFAITDKDAELDCKIFREENPVSALEDIPPGHYECELISAPGDKPMAKITKGKYAGRIIK